MTASKHHHRRTALIVTGSVVTAVLLLVAITLSGEDDDNANGIEPGTTAIAVDGDVETTTQVSVTFLPDAAHEQLPAAPGCDQLAFHSAMAMWSPSLADEMLAAGCPFPFEPESIDLRGGEEDPDISAPFEPRPFRELFDLLNVEGTGICAVRRLGEESVRGFVWGFEVTAQSGGCATNQPDITMRVREYATRAHRDEAANGLPSGGALVLGRWTIELEGTTVELHSGLVGLGAAVIA